MHYTCPRVMEGLSNIVFVFAELDKVYNASNFFEMNYLLPQYEIFYDAFETTVTPDYSKEIRKFGGGQTAGKARKRKGCYAVSDKTARCLDRDGKI